MRLRDLIWITTNYSYKEKQIDRSAFLCFYKCEVDGHRVVAIIKAAVYQANNATKPSPIYIRKKNA